MAMSTPTLVPSDEADSLTSLEERIHRAVQLLTRLRKEKDDVEKMVEDAMAEREAAQKSVDELKAQNAALAEELESLKSERKQVRSRIEKLLGQMDLLSAS
jgi:peptidoglycan hydrolase CwlO-like protein